MDKLKLNDSEYLKSIIVQSKKGLSTAIKEYSNAEIASKIDHTILKPETTPADIIKICSEALEYKFASVCVNSCYAALVSEQLENSNVKTCVVVGFPLGAMNTAAKVAEAEDAVKNGAEELDMVINIGMLKSENYDFLLQDIKAVSDMAHSGNALCKVIIETSLLTDEEKIKACLLSKKAGADFVKTSTGFNGGGATVEDVHLMKTVVKDELKVKASGGIRSKEDALKMLSAGADRIGASAGVKIVTNQKAEGSY